MPRLLDSALLAIDLATSSVRTALFDARARPIRGFCASPVYRVRHTIEHGAELDPALLSRAARKSLRQTLSLTNDAPRAIGKCARQKRLKQVAQSRPNACSQPLTIPCFRSSPARSKMKSRLASIRMRTIRGEAGAK